MDVQGLRASGLKNRSILGLHTSTAGCTHLSLVLDADLESRYVSGLAQVSRQLQHFRGAARFLVVKCMGASKVYREAVHHGLSRLFLTYLNSSTSQPHPPPSPALLRFFNDQPDSKLGFMMPIYEPWSRGLLQGLSMPPI